MFGAVFFGQPYFGQTYPDTTTPLATVATIPFATTASLTITATFRADTTIAVGTDTNLNVISHLVGAADTTIAVGTVAQISGSTQLTAASSVVVSSTPPFLALPADLRTTSTVTIASVANANLSIGAIHLEAAAAVAWATAPPTLARTPQFFAAASTVVVATLGDLRVTGPTATDPIVTFDGVASAQIRRGSITITDVLNEQANTADLMLDDGPPPRIDADVKIGLQNTLPGNLLFGGVVTKIAQRYELQPSHLSWAISCDDYTTVINRRLVNGTFLNESASSVATRIVAAWAPGFSPAGIAAGLPAITVTFNGTPVMEALTQIAGLIGGYCDIDPMKIVLLFITSPGTDPPHVVDGSPASGLLLTPPVTVETDETPVRDRIFVVGDSAGVGGSPGFSIPTTASVIPIDDATIFSSGFPASYVLTDDAQWVSYSGVARGGVASTVTGNVPAPTQAPLAAIAVGVAGGLSGVYQWAVAFWNEGGETEIGPATTPPLLCSPFATPSFPMGLGAAPGVGPLVGTYRYCQTFVTNLGETLPGPAVQRTAVALVPPTAPVVGDGPAAGPLAAGAVYRYVVTYVTASGETAPSPPVAYTPTALSPPGFFAPGAVPFGGLATSGSYSYGVTLVTAVGESAPPNAAVVGANFVTAPPPGTVSWSGNQDTAGRIAPGTYAYALSWYSDTYGETALGNALVFPIGGTVPIRVLMNLPIGATALPARCDGLRVYRQLQGVNPTAFQLNADFRLGSVPTQWVDVLSQGECGNPWPVHPIRAGVSMAFTLLAATTPGVIARRLYRTRANGAEYFLVGEVQNNTDQATFLDSVFDNQLTIRNPAAPTTGRQATVILPTSPTSPPLAGLIGRRVYRTKANDAVYYLVADLKDVTTTTIVDSLADTSLTGATLPTLSTAGGERHQLTSIAIGPAGTLARRVYRTVGNGTDYQLVVQINDNTTTSYLDQIPDAQLGASAPLTNTAGAAAVTLTQVPIGPPGITQRILYRTAAGGTKFLYIGTLDNNTATTFLDDKPDTSLGRAPQATSSIGANAGDTSVRLNSVVGFPVPGWFDADSQVIYYTQLDVATNTLSGIPPLLGVSSLTRTGVTATMVTVAPHGFTTGQRVVVLGATQPEYNGTQTVTVTSATSATYAIVATAGTPATPPSGKSIVTSAAGAITGAIAGGLTIKTVPMLTGVSGLVWALKPGARVRLLVVRGAGAHDYQVEDSTLQSNQACAARGDAELLLNQQPRVTVTYATLDRKTRSGKTITLALGPPTNVSGTFLIQQVRITDIGIAARTNPRYTVTASNARYSLSDLLRHVVVNNR